MTSLDNLEFRSPIAEIQRKKVTDVLSAGGSDILLHFNQVWQKRLASLWKYLLGEGTNIALDFPNTASGRVSELAVPIPGVGLGGFVEVAPREAPLIIAGTFYRGVVTADGEVTVQFCNMTAGAIDPPEGKFDIRVRAR